MEEQTYYKLKVIEEEISLARARLMTVRETARRLGLTESSISGRLDRGSFTTIVDPRAPARQGRRLLLREEVEEEARRLGRPLDGEEEEDEEWIVVGSEEWNEEPERPGVRRA